MLVNRRKIVLGIWISISIAFLFLVEPHDFSFAQSSGSIIAVAGTGTAGFNGDGGLATSAQINKSEGVALDSLGNLYIADTGNHRIRKVTPEGVISTVAGTGTRGFSGDGGLAIFAQLADPDDVAVDSEGNLYVADFNNHRIRKITPEGVINTVAGGGKYPGDGGPATSGGLLCPLSVALDSVGNLYISESMVFDADNLPDRIRKVTPDGIISTVAGKITEYPGDGGPATSVGIIYPYKITTDTMGNLFFAELCRVRRITPDGEISTVAGSGTCGYSGDGVPATSAQIYWPAGIAIDVEGNIFFAESENNCIRKISVDGIISTVLTNLNSPIDIELGPQRSLYIVEFGGNRILKALNWPAMYFPEVIAGDEGSTLSISTNTELNEESGSLIFGDSIALSAGGAGTASTVGGNPNAQAGYATVEVDSGAVPYGTAVFSIKSGEVTVSEVGVPASPPTVASRIFIDYRFGVNAIPARGDAGIVDVNTGIAVTNNSSAGANVTYTLRDASGSTLSIGHGTIDAGKHFSCFINQLADVAAPDFNLPEIFQTAIQFGTLDIASDQPLSVMALRGTYNQKQQFIMTTTPVADLAQFPDSSPLHFAQFVDGGGYTTSLILMNTSSVVETGKLEIRNNHGDALSVYQVGGVFGSSFSYSIPPNGIYHFQTDGSPLDWNVGWAQLIPDPGTMTPKGSGVYGYNPFDVLVTESGVPSASATTHARVYVDRSGNHNTGLAIANMNDTAATITMNAYETDGTTMAGISNGPLTIVSYGHDAQFASQLITGLPPEFTGVLDISSTTRFAALTVRTLYNENGDYLMTTFPVADVNQTAPSPIVFPQIADGGGYETQFILLSMGGESSATINYYASDGASFTVGK